MMCRLEAPLLGKVGLCVSIAALGFDIIGLSTTYWISGSGLQKGLFSDCDEILDDIKCHKDNGFGSGLQKGLFSDCDEILDDIKCHKDNGFALLTVAKVLNILGLIIGVGSVVIVMLSMTLINGSKKLLPIISFVVAMSAGLCIIIGSAIFANNFVPVSETLSWSFVLTIIGGLLFLSAGIVLIIAFNARLKARKKMRASTENAFY